MEKNEFLNVKLLEKVQTWELFCAAGAPKIERTLASQQGREASCSRRRKKTTQAMPDDTHAKNKCSDFSLKSFARLLPFPMIFPCLISGLLYLYPWLVGKIRRQVLSRKFVRLDSHQRVFFYCLRLEGTIVWSRNFLLPPSNWRLFWPWRNWRAQRTASHLAWHRSQIHLKVESREGKLLCNSPYDILSDISMLILTWFLG